MFRFVVLSSLIIGSIWSTALCNAEASGDAAHKFTADWITARDAPGHDPSVLRLRKEISLSVVPSHFIVHVSADNQFLLFVNGKRIGQGPAIGDVQHWRYETYDLAPALHPGRNLIAATVWNLGDEAPIRQITSHLGFVLDPDSKTEDAAATNSTWLVRRDSGFTFLSKPKEMEDFYYVAPPVNGLTLNRSTGIGAIQLDRRLKPSGNLRFLLAVPLLAEFTPNRTRGC